MRLPRTGRGSGPGRVLARAATVDGDDVTGTRDALVLPGGDTVAWEDVRSADWDQDSSVLQVVEVAEWGQVDPVHRLALEQPGRLLELVRERVTASVVLSRRVPVEGTAGLRVVARRPPGTRGPIAWFVEYDDGIDPDDPVTRAAAETALGEARRDVGE